MTDFYFVLTLIVVIANVIGFAYIIILMRQNPNCEDIDNEYEDMDLTITLVNMSNVSGIVKESDFR